METDTQEHEYGPPILVVACISWEEQRTWLGCNLECFIGDMTISKPHHGTSYSNSLFNRFDVSSASPSSSYKLSLRSLNRLSWAGWEEEDGAAVVVTGEQYPGFYDSGGPATTRTGKIGKKEEAAVGCDTRAMSFMVWLRNERCGGGAENKQITSLKWTCIFANLFSAAKTEYSRTSWHHRGGEARWWCLLVLAVVVVGGLQLLWCHQNWWQRKNAPQSSTAWILKFEAFFFLLWYLP